MTTPEKKIAEAIIEKDDTLLLESNVLFAKRYILSSKDGVIHIKAWVGKNYYDGEGKTLHEAFKMLLDDINHVFVSEFWLVQKAFNLHVDDWLDKKLGIGKHETNEGDRRPDENE